MWWILIGAAVAGEPSLTGTWVLDETDEALRARHEAAVQSALDQLPWALRPLARSPLQQIIGNCRELELGVHTETFRLRCDAHPELRVDPRRSPQPVEGQNGERIEMRIEAAPHAATLAFQGPEGGQRTAYHLDGDRLVVTTRLQGERLPEPVTWTVRYRRAAAGDSSG